MLTPIAVVWNNTFFVLLASVSLKRVGRAEDRESSRLKGRRNHKEEREGIPDLRVQGQEGGLPPTQPLVGVGRRGIWWRGVVPWHSRVRLFATPWTAAHQASLSFTISWSLLKLMSVELSVMPSNHLILCCRLLLLPSVFPNIRVFSNESGGQSIGASASASMNE